MHRTPVFGQKMLLAPGLPGVRYLKLQKIQISKVQKIKIKYLGVAKYIYYNLLNFNTKYLVV
jgi:hypothetical protein